MFEEQNMKKEFIACFKDAVENQIRAGGKGRAGEEMEIIVPALCEFSIDAEDLKGVNLDNVKISVFEDDTRRDASGNVIFDRGMFPPGIVLYRITGIVR